MKKLIDVCDICEENGVKRECEICHKKMCDDCSYIFYIPTSSKDTLELTFKEYLRCKFDRHIYKEDCMVCKNCATSFCNCLKEIDEHSLKTKELIILITEVIIKKHLNDKI